MGCHTWFYKKINPQPTREDKIHQCVERLNKACIRLENALLNDGFGWKKIDKWYPYSSREKVAECLHEYKWMLDNVNHYEDYCNEDNPLTKEYKLYEKVEDWEVSDDEFTMSINGIYYCEIDKYHDLFRYNKYDTCVTSEDEMWKLIEDNHIDISDDVKEKLKEFWSLYPDGVIDFG